MVEVIGQDDQVFKKCTCRNCGAMLQYRPSEIRILWSGTDYGGGPDGAKGFNCPQCGERVILERW